MNYRFTACLLLSALTLLGCSATRPVTPPGETLLIESFDGMALAYDDRGAVESDSCLLFIHGLCCERGFWSEQALRFADDYRVITVDLGGHGESGVEREAWLLDDLSRDVVALVETLELSNVILVGHSMGGPVSLLAAEQLNSQPHSQIQGIVAVDALHDPGMRVELEMMQPYLDAMAADYADFWNRSVQGTFLPGADQSVIDRVLRVANQTPFEVTHGLMTSFPAFDLGEALANCTVPVRCINSSMTPTKLDEAQAIAIDFDATIMEGVGHFLMLEAPDQFERELQKALASMQ